MDSPPSVLLQWGGRGKTGLHQMSARASFAVGLHAEALQAVRRARRGASAAQGALLAVTEAEALSSLQRHREALGVAGRALARRPLDRDVAARLRIARGQALWMQGRNAPGVAEVRRAAAEAETPATRAAAHEALALLAWKDQDLAGAEDHLARSRDLYTECRSTEGLAGTLAKQAGVHCSAGRFAAALRTQDQRVDLASTTTRLDLLALAHGDRGDLLANLGRWDDARRDLERAAELFRRVSDPREVTLAGASLAMVELAAGDLARARAAVERVRMSPALQDGSPRHEAELRLLVSDVELAWGSPEAANRAGAEALALFGLVKDREGECRSRVRCAHAQLALGHAEAALREARSAVASVPRGRADLRALAVLTLGRVQLRGSRAEARKAFDALLRGAAARPGLAHTARMGQALATAVSRDDEAVREALAALECWGDRRILSFALADLDQVLGPGSMPVAAPPETAEPPPPPLCADAAALLDAALACAGEGDWPTRLGRVMRSVRSALPWSGVAWVGAAGGFELRADVETPIALREGDLPCMLSRSAREPRRVSLREEPWALFPARVRHALSEALVAPAGPDATLYVDFRDATGRLDPSRLRLVASLARLVSGQASGEGVDSSLEPPEFPEMIGRSSGMLALYGALARVAASDAPVHVFGETGTGKEKVARALHARSRRARRPFVALNASSLTDELFESELFGHVRGAFTGAVADRRGQVAEAEGGTLFLDEVSDLTLRGQAKLLRFLQEGEYQRLGETVRQRADVRVITAANLGLEEQVRQGRFREDLMYRLNALVLNLPPLRERGGDVLLLARHFLKLAAGREGRSVAALRPELGRILEAWHWPGNVRELENEMRRLVVLSGGGLLSSENLSPRLRAAPSNVAGSLRQSLQSFERGVIREVLLRHAGSRSRTASELGVTRQALLGKMKRLGV